MTTKVSIFRVEELDCATEENELRAALGALDGVQSLEFDLVARHIRIRHQLATPDSFATAIRAAGMRPKLVIATSGTLIAPTTRSLPRKTIITIVAAGVLAIGSELIVIAGVKERSVPVAAMALVSIALGGRDTLRKGAQAMKSRRLTMALLMTIAVIGALIIGQWPEAAVVIWLFGLAELIEALSLERARNAIRSLVALAPETALLKVEGRGWVATPTPDVSRDAVVLVKPGDRIPLDGTVSAGSSTVNQAPITGESVPVRKDPGAPVFAGTINERGTLEIRVTAEAGEGTLDRIARSIQTAQAEKAPAQRFVDRFASIYTPLVFLTAIAVAVLPPLLDGGTWRDWFYKSLVLLVLACPCALVISTPVTVVSGLGGAARRGILIKGGVHLEQARRVGIVAVDKTGTLTHGKPVLTDVIVLGDMSTEDVSRIAASIEALSEHPVAHAIVIAHKGPVDQVSNFEAIPGHGVQGTVNGVQYLLGNHRLAEQKGVCSPGLETMLQGFEADAKSAVVLMTGRQTLAVLAVADTIRPQSVEAVEALHRLGVRVVMLTGDNQRTADAVARSVGIDEALADLLPEDKLRMITQLGTRGHVAMVGDGVNDAPAMAKATLGIAMGAAGTDTAIETADIALMDDDPRKIAETIRISRHTSHVLWQNIAVALGVKVVFFALTILGAASLWLAVLADMGASLVVIANGLRLLRRPSHDRLVTRSDHTASSGNLI